MPRDQNPVARQPAQSIPFNPSLAPFRNPPAADMQASFEPRAASPAVFAFQTIVRTHDRFFEDIFPPVSITYAEFLQRRQSPLPLLTQEERRANRRTASVWRQLPRWPFAPFFQGAPPGDVAARPIDKSPTGTMLRREPATCRRRGSSAFICFYLRPIFLDCQPERIGPMNRLCYPLVKTISSHAQ
jgi:hypothetical protein